MCQLELPLISWRMFRRLANHGVRSCSSSTYYNLLGVRSDATKAEIKSAFLQLSKKHHPDLNPSRAEDAHKKFKAISEAYSTLIDPAKRSLYDQQLFRSIPHFTGTVDDSKFGFYKYDPRANAYKYARAYNYYDYSEAQWEELKRRSGAVREQRSHYGVVKMLLLFMVVGTVLHTTRLYFIHKNHQQKSQETTRRNQEIYAAVREKGRTNVVPEQLKKMAQDSKSGTTSSQQNQKIS